VPQAIGILVAGEVGPAGDVRRIQSHGAGIIDEPPALSPNESVLAGRGDQ